MAEIGSLLGGKYRLLRLVGQGGMGAVYEAEHERIGKRLAIKVVNPALSKDRGLTARLEREARAAAATGHRGVIDIYDVGEDEEGSLFLVMQLLEGESLGRLVERSAPLPVPLVAELALQILSALDAVHDKGILHRDLKPDNVFLVPSNGPVPDVKLLDFGLSKPERGLASDRITQTGTVMGTPQYMAPEQLLGRSDLDRRVDVYSMGVILYQCLTDALPFEGETIHALVDRVLHHPVRPPREIRPEIPPELEAVVLGAMARDREQRPESARAMAGALVPFAEQVGVARSFPPVTIPPVDSELTTGPTICESPTLQGAVRGLPTREKGEARRLRTGVIVAALAVVALSAVTGLFMLRPDGEGSGAALAPPGTGDGIDNPRGDEVLSGDGQGASPAADGGATGATSVADAGVVVEGSTDGSATHDAASDGAPAGTAGPGGPGRQEEPPRSGRQRDHRDRRRSSEEPPEETQDDWRFTEETQEFGH